MVTINLRDFYYWYTHDNIIDVPEDVAAELRTGKRQHNAQGCARRRNKVLSLDTEDGISNIVSTYSTDNPEAVLEMKERYCCLCRALNKLPIVQGRRLEMRYLCGMGTDEIARAEGVSESAVKYSLSRALANMKWYLLPGVAF